MSTLESQPITDLYCLVDSLVPQVQKPSGGRPQLLSDAELVTSLLWKGLTVQQHTLKDIWKWLRREQKQNFPRVPKYKGFLAHCHRNLKVLASLLEKLLLTTSRIRLVDSTVLQVCKLSRADSHKVAGEVASFGKNGSGWHFGFKLHATFNPDGLLAAFCFTPANESDVMQLPRLVEENMVAVGNAGYTARVMRGKLWREKRCLVVSTPRQKQNSQVLTNWQY